MLAKIIKFKKIVEDNASLSVFQENESIPFNSKRSFTVITTKNSFRGDHAHKNCHQFLICLKGEIKVNVDDGTNQQVFIIKENDDYGIYIPPLIWASQSSIKDENILLVIASDLFKNSDYIRDKKEFLNYIKK